MEMLKWDKLSNVHVMLTQNENSEQGTFQWENKGNNIDLVCFYRMIGLEELAGKRKMPTWVPFCQQ